MQLVQNKRIDHIRSILFLNYYCFLANGATPFDSRYAPQAEHIQYMAYMSISRVTT